MDPFMIFIKHSCQNMNIYSMEDIAILKCVSKEIKNDLDEIYKCETQSKKIYDQSCKILGCSTEINLTKPTVLNRDFYTKNMIQLNRYYNEETIKNRVQRAKLNSFLKEFTLHNCKNVFTKFQNITIEEQTNTVSELLNYTEISNNNMGIKVLAIYLIYYFLLKLYKKNGSHFIKNVEKCILGSINFRFTCVSKANENVRELKEQITLLPYTFTDKVIRLLKETSRQISQI